MWFLTKYSFILGNIHIAKLFVIYLWWLIMMRVQELVFDIWYTIKHSLIDTREEDIHEDSNLGLEKRQKIHGVTFRICYLKVMYGIYNLQCFILVPIILSIYLWNRTKDESLKEQLKMLNLAQHKLSIIILSKITISFFMLYIYMILYYVTISISCQDWI